VTRFERVYLGIQHTLTISARPVFGAQGILASPHNRGGRLALAKIVLPSGVVLKIRSIIIEEAKLNISFTRLVQERVLVGPGIRIDHFGMRIFLDLPLSWGLKGKKILA
jgi:hypothetical protein